MKKKRYVIVCAFVFMGIIFSSHRDLYSFTDQTTSERILKENRHFIHFINVCLTNFATEDRREDFKNVYQIHFNADVAYLQADYKRAYKKVYKSQGEMVKLYKNILKNYYLEDSKNILDTIAPMIIRSKNARARLYLTLGYRDRTVSWTHYTVGDASNPKLFSYKLYKYEEAIKMARRAKRYGFLALFESQNNEMKRKIYYQLLKNEQKKGNPFFGRFLDLDEEGTYKEIVKSYSEHEKELKKIEAATGTKRTSTVFEKNVEKRVRFKSEVRAAKFLLTTEFDRAEDIIRKYVDDFNFQVIIATFETLSAGASGETETTPGDDYMDEKIDYRKYKVHLMDNYARFSKGSMLDTFFKDMKVEDDVKKRKEIKSLAEKKGLDTSQPKEDIKDTEEETIDKPDETEE